MSAPEHPSLSQQERDQIFNSLKKRNSNHVCFDCGKKNPKWASIHLGLHLCIDCAGKHRQYGVMYSFVKSINLDVWNKKQIIFMEKGGNDRALTYFKKHNISDNINYKSDLVQQYKTILTKEVQIQLYGVTPSNKQLQQPIKSIKQEEKKEIPEAQKFIEKQSKEKKKKKKKIGQKVKVDFNSIEFDDGVQNTITIQEPINEEESTPYIENQEQAKEEFKQAPKEEAKELTEEQSLVRLSTMKTCSSISSQNFKNSDVKQSQIGKKLTKFGNSASISSNDLFGEEVEEAKMSKIKGMVSDVGVRIGEKISSRGVQIYDNLKSYWYKKR